MFKRYQEFNLDYLDCQYCHLSNRMRCDPMSIDSPGRHSPMTVTAGNMQREDKGANEGARGTPAAGDKTDSGWSTSRKNQGRRISRTHQPQAVLVGRHAPPQPLQHAHGRSLHLQHHLACGGVWWGWSGGGSEATIKQVMYKATNGAVASHPATRPTLQCIIYTQTAETAGTGNHWHATMNPAPVGG